MGRGLITILMSIPLSILSLIIFWIQKSWRVGLMAACVVVSAAIIVAAIMLFTQKKISLADILLPPILSVIWSIMLVPFSLGTEVFTAPSCVGSGFILSLSLWQVRNSMFEKKWLILPFIVYCYEMLPINIPGPFDDYFAFGGDIVYTIIFYAKARFKQDQMLVSENASAEQVE